MRALIAWHCCVRNVQPPVITLSSLKTLLLLTETVQLRIDYPRRTLRAPSQLHS